MMEVVENAVETLRVSARPAPFTRFCSPARRHLISASSQAAPGAAIIVIASGDALAAARFSRLLTPPPSSIFAAQAVMCNANVRLIISARIG
jgi:hypothetical protein